MATVKAVIREDKINAKNEAPIYLRITKNRKTTFLSLQISVPPLYWDKERECIKKNNKIKGYVRLNNFIDNERVRMKNQLVEAEQSDRTLSSKKIKDIIKGEEEPDFFEFAEQYQKTIESSESVRLYNQYKAILNKLERFNKSRQLKFSEITVSYLKRFSEHLATECKNRTNTISTNLKVIRKLYNLATLEEVVPEERNPFKKLKLEWEKTNIGYLTKEDIDKIRHVELDPMGKDYHIRNMFVFAMYTGGLRFSDLLMLRWEDVQDDERVKVYTQKTKTNLTVKLTNVSLAILSIYRPSTYTNASGFIFPFLDNDKNYSNPKYLYRRISSINAVANTRLREIGKKSGINKHLHFHMSRHTFATRGLEIGMPLTHISKLMGHSSVAMTENYAKLINKELDKAMDLIDKYEEANNDRQL
ncbi:Tyrosine recombinase XerC [Sphingobacterium spiritivorum]|nr:site-specific integrase [Sphingobacterium spiritivorum]QQT37689.1 site-specific integrase [Sphingobacterium spiritivorum]SUI97472.1 Tyrosine recombinase XerC [Sphingobacterium spiritivorum]